MSGRTIAIGDIHGCLAALETLLRAIDPRPDDTIITLGDYVDRGPDSCGVIELLCDLATRTHSIPLLGNHDEMMLLVTSGRMELISDWMLFGGQATLDSYRAARPEEIWPRHLEFLRSCRLFYETDRHFFVHGNYLPGVPLGEQPREALMWESLKRRVPGPHFSGKTAIVGHTAQKTGAILDLGYLRCIDTWCYGGRWLTALEVNSNEIWRANQVGELL